MLWSTLYNRIGRQPLSFTRHNHIEAVLDNRRVEMDLKYDAHGRPYLVPRDPNWNHHKRKDESNA